MLYLRQLLTTLLILFLGTSCSSIMVSQDYDPSTPFSQYTQFALEQKDPHRNTDPRYDNELINDRFYRYISKRLEEKGFIQRANNQVSDFTVSFNYSVRPKMDMYNISKQVGFTYGSYHRYGGIGARTCTDISEFDQGLLLIDIKDASTGKLIWRGTGTDIISIYATPEDISNQIEGIVAAVLRNFPPQ